MTTQWGKKAKESYSRKYAMLTHYSYLIQYIMEDLLQVYTCFLSGFIHSVSIDRITSFPIMETPLILPPPASQLK